MPYLDIFALVVAIGSSAIAAGTFRMIENSLYYRAVHETLPGMTRRDMFGTFAPLLIFAAVVAAHFLMPWWIPVPAYIIITQVAVRLSGTRPDDNAEGQIRAIPRLAFISMVASSFVIWQAVQHFFR